MDTRGFAAPMFCEIETDILSTSVCGVQSVAVYGEWLAFVLALAFALALSFLIVWGFQLGN